MSVNTSIITDTGKATTANTVEQYGNGVFVHTANSAWSQHNQVCLHTSTPYLEASGDVAGVYTLRMQLTRDNSGTPVDIALALPVHPTGLGVSSGTNPVIISHPASLTVNVGSNAQFYVTAISDGPMTYQWEKNQATIASQTARKLIFPSVVSTDQARYRVIVSNSHGTTASNEAQLIVNSSATGGRVGEVDLSSDWWLSGIFGFPFSTGWF